MTTIVQSPRTFPEIVALDQAALARLEIDPGLGAFSGYRPGRTDIVRESLGRVLRAPGGEVFAAVTSEVLVGYLLIGPVPIDQPWGRLRDPRVLEVAIEVARGQRGQGVAEALFRRAFARPEVESRLYVATGYVWCWDVAPSGADASRYAVRLLRLFERFGFQHEWTNEPNIAMEPVNFLAVRIGRMVPAALVRRLRQAERGEAAA